MAAQGVVDRINIVYRLYDKVKGELAFLRYKRKKNIHENLAHVFNIFSDEMGLGKTLQCISLIWLVPNLCDDSLIKDFQLKL